MSFFRACDCYYVPCEHNPELKERKHNTKDYNAFWGLMVLVAIFVTFFCGSLL